MSGFGWFIVGWFFGWIVEAIAVGVWFMRGKKKSS
jgi:hypothetical protein